MVNSKTKRKPKSFKNNIRWNNRWELFILSLWGI